MTTIDRERLRKLADAATPGPWEFDWDPEEGDLTVRAGTARYGDNGRAPGSYVTTDMIIEHEEVWEDDGLDQYARDAEFIAAARDAIPQLLDALDQAEAERDWNWRSSRHSKIERIRAIARADRAEAEARAQRRRADDMEDNALRAQTNLRAAEERVDEWARTHLAAQEPTDAECIAFWYAFEDAADETNIENIRAALSAAQPRPLMHETPPAITLSRIRQLTYNAKRRNETIRPDQILAILEQRKA